MHQRKPEKRKNKSPDQTTEKQLDYVIINDKYKNIVKTIHTAQKWRPNTNNIQHCAIIAKIGVKLKIKPKPPNPTQMENQQKCANGTNIQEPQLHEQNWTKVEYQQPDYDKQNSQQNKDEILKWKKTNAIHFRNTIDEYTYRAPSTHGTKSLNIYRKYTKMYIQTTTKQNAAKKYKEARDGRTQAMSQQKPKSTS